MKKLGLALSLLLLSSTSFAQSVYCKTEYGLKVQEVQIVNNNNTFDVFFNGERQMGFNCLSKSNAAHFQDVVRCVSPNGSAIHVFNTNPSRTNATLIYQYSPKILMTCVDASESL